MGSDFMIDAGLYLSYAMFFVAFLAALAFPIWEILTSMEAAKKDETPPNGTGEKKRPIITKKKLGKQEDER